MRRRPAPGSGRGPRVTRPPRFATAAAILPASACLSIPTANRAAPATPGTVSTAANTATKTSPSARHPSTWSGGETPSTKPPLGETRARYVPGTSTELESKCAGVVGGGLGRPESSSSPVASRAGRAPREAAAARIPRPPPAGCSARAGRAAPPGRAVPGRRPAPPSRRSRCGSGSSPSAAPSGRPLRRPRGRRRPSGPRRLRRSRRRAGET